MGGRKKKKNRHGGASFGDKKRRDRGRPKGGAIGLSPLISIDKGPRRTSSKKRSVHLGPVGRIGTRKRGMGFENVELACALAVFG